LLIDDLSSIEPPSPIDNSASNTPTTGRGFEQYDVLVIGAGAAGLLAAAVAAERGKRTLLVEKNRRPGVKILMSGGTRCNLTHATDKWGIIQAYREQGNFLHSALAALGPGDLIKLIEDEGVPTKVEETGKVFPVSNRATDVLAALIRRLERSGAELRLATPVTGIERGSPTFHVGQAGEKPLPRGNSFEDGTPLTLLAHTESGPAFAAAKIIITVGGQSYPGSGTTGDGYAWAAALGHTIVPPRPALVPLTTDAVWVREISGVTVPDVALSLSLGNHHCRGSLLFTHFGLSGPAALDISRYVTAAADPTVLKLVCDFLPDVRPDALDSQIRDAAAREGKRQIAGWLAPELPRRLVEQLVKLAGVPAELKGAELSKPARAALVRALKSAEIPLTGTRGFAKAEVTAGGVALSEIDSRTMQSKLVPSLYFAGEILDLDGPIGGYNFQAAFSTGYLAGMSA
jgi:predicted flavoprotein YhiN